MKTKINVTTVDTQLSNGIWHHPDTSQTSLLFQS